MPISKRLLHRKIAILFFTLLSVSIAGPSIQAQQQAPLPGESVANSPQMTTGDQWILNTSRGLRFHKVIDVKLDGAFVVEVKNKEGVVLWHRYHDKDYRVLKTDYLTPIEKAKSEAPWEKVLNFPLFIGKKWQDEYHGTGADDTPRTYKNSYTVEKIEMVDTPIGTFSAFKIHRNYSATGIKRNQDQYYWYAPEVKIVIKLVHVGELTTKEGHAIQNELVSYQPAAKDKGKSQAESTSITSQTNVPGITPDAKGLGIGDSPALMRFGW